MNKYPQISPRQWFHISLFSTICVTPFGFPSILYRHLGNEAWLPIVAAYLLTLWNVYVTLRICERFKDLNLVQWSKKILGRWFGRLYSIGTIIVFYLWGLLMLYIFLELIMYTQLPFTSRFLLLLFIVGVAVFLLVMGLEVWVRWGELFSILLIIGLLLINVPQFMNVSFSQILPLNTTFLEPMKYFKPEIIGSLFIFRGIFSLYFLYPHIKKSNGLFRWSILSMTVAFIEVLLAVVLPIMIFGASFAGKLRFPYQESLGTVTLVWLPIERLAILTPVVWQLIIIYVLCISLFSTARGLKSLFNVKKEQKIIYILGVVTLGLAMYPLQSQIVSMFITYWSFLGLILLTVIPTLIWMILTLKGTRTR
ncbi:GerAB/ArcD/ProY family transporter [Oceanobacillus sp. CAU 1775]